MTPKQPHRVIIVGGGFAGLNAARALAEAPVEVTLIDRHNYHLFQPLLYQVAAAELSPADIAEPLRGILARQQNTRVLLGEARDIDVERRELVLADERVPYDTLILATGARDNYFGNDHWAEHAPGLKTIESATDIRRRVLLAFEIAERESDEERRRAALTFVIVGAGPTGVELAGAIAEIARHTLRHDFRRVRPETAQVILVELGDRVLAAYDPRLSQRAEEQLEDLCVDVRTGTRIEDIRAGEVTLRSGEQAATLKAHTILWAAGVGASDLGRVLAERMGCTLDRTGRVVVEPDLSVPGHPEIFVLGDLAHFAHPQGPPLPGLAPVAMQQGRYVSEALRRRARGAPCTPFRYVDRGTMATIGRSKAVADIRGLRFSGLPAWLAWLFLHLMFLVGYQNRVLVFVQWAWNYITWKRGARLITGPHPPPLSRNPADGDEA